LDDQGSIPSIETGLSLQPLCPDQLWRPLSLLSNGYRVSFPRGKVQPGHDADCSPHLMLNTKSPLPFSAFMVAEGQLYLCCFTFTFTFKVRAQAAWSHIYFLYTQEINMC
jgi:hypothetical protein